ncbi:hypothetical protein MVEN_00350600 [Mycena venus]|uniref:F-box domain-containing protein n=1 Tax=Mycena venus TaxID=2733690 RepID=A0A8H6YVW3_9AGAR|nr:hypothetical protein MVEN_00350600 [Mycena venus]
MSAQEAPLLLCRICSSWRTIALSTPRLWSSIHIAVPHDKLPQHVHDGCLELVKAWLARSGGLPLSISFYRHYPPGPSPFFDTIVSLSSRWKHISVLGQQIRLSRADVPMLQSIEILDHTIGDEPADAHDVFCGDSIRSVSLGTNGNPIQLPLPWSQLTILSLDRFQDPRTSFSQGWPLSSSMALNILAQCRNLHECAISLSSGVDDTVDVPSSVELPLLSSLVILVRAYYVFAPQQRDPLDRLRLPQLSSFALTGPRLDQDSAGGFPFPTLLSTATKLKDFELDPLLLCTKEALLTFMKLLPPSVQRLVLRQNVRGSRGLTLIDNEFLHLLAPASHGQAADKPLPGAGFLLPELIELNCTAGFSDKDLLYFIRARMRYQRLRRVRVQFYRPVEKDILPELRSFIEEFGLDVLLEYNKHRDIWNPRDGLPKRSRTAQT